MNLQSETVEALQRLNETFKFLLRVSEHSKEQLNWIQGLVSTTGKADSEMALSLILAMILPFSINSEKRLGKLSTWVIHVCYLLLGMLLLAFLQAPSYTRWLFLMIIPVNLAMELRHGYVMDLPALVGLLIGASLGNFHFVFNSYECLQALNHLFNSIETVCHIILYLRSLCGREKQRESICAAPACETPTPTKETDVFSFAENSCMNSTVLDSRNSTPVPTFDLADLDSLHQPSMRSILQDRLDDSIASSVYRRSSRLSSFREMSPNRSLTPAPSRRYLQRILSS